jgi:CheY-like chemotaxis protein
MASAKTVLVIEDDMDARFVLGAILNYDGYRMLSAADGAQGVALACRHLPDIIIMDVHMPGMGGLEAAAALRDDERTRSIPIVAISGDWEVLDSRPTLTRALFHSWLAKPLEPRRLMEHIRGIIGDP